MIFGWYGWSIRFKIMKSLFVLSWFLFWNICSSPEINWWIPPHLFWSLFVKDTSASKWLSNHSPNQSRKHCSNRFFVNKNTTMQAGVLRFVHALWKKRQSKETLLGSWDQTSLQDELLLLIPPVLASRNSLPDLSSHSAFLPIFTSCFTGDASLPAKTLAI